MKWSVNQRTGLTHYRPAGSFKGYTLFAPDESDSAYLLDMDGRVVHRWHLPGARILLPQLLPNGALLVLGKDASTPIPERLPFDQPPQPFAERVHLLGGNAGHLWELDWDGRIVWEYSNPAIHHDAVRLENGHTIVAESVELPTDLAKAVRGGVKRPREKLPPLISDDIVEIDTDGKEVARVHLWEQLDPVRDPICPLETRWEWTHLNSLSLTPDGGLVFSCRNNSRVGILDWPSGKLRWKFGAPEVTHQHHATALPNGHIQIFDNGMHRIGLPFSRVVEVNPADSQIVWEYTSDPAEQFFSAHISGAHRLPNGNVLICEGAPGRLFEVTQRCETVWEWISPFTTHNQGVSRSSIFRAYRYGPDYSGLTGRTLDPSTWADLNRLHGLYRADQVFAAQ